VSYECQAKEDGEEDSGTERWVIVIVRIASVFGDVAVGVGGDRDAGRCCGGGDRGCGHGYRRGCHGDGVVA